ncbi:MAG: hypothetical protein KA524_07570 [Nitrosomonas sp.]|nr:hypothetical protein [Nitrosomonas sp.]MBP6076028.1 hypothetical protein [Nitrosomonas sp.]
MNEDLFGEISVTYEDIDKWMNINAPRIRENYKESYIKNWNVIEKIKKAKKDGTFQ